jgi:hypothetical protein
MAASVFEWYENNGEKDRLCNEQGMDRVGYAFEIIWQMKIVSDEELNGV